jgi:hypothetical protein
MYIFDLAATPFPVPFQLHLLRNPSYSERRLAVSELCMHIVMTTLRRVAATNEFYGVLRHRNAVVGCRLLDEAWPELFLLQLARWPLDILTLAALAHPSGQPTADTTVGRPITGMHGV